MGSDFGLICGTRRGSLPLLPSGPGGVREHPSHRARSLTSSMFLPLPSSSNRGMLARVRAARRFICMRAVVLFRHWRLARCGKILAGCHSEQRIPAVLVSTNCGYPSSSSALLKIASFPRKRESIVLTMGPRFRGDDKSNFHLLGRAAGSGQLRRMTAKRFFPQALKCRG